MRAPTAAMASQRPQTRRGEGDSSVGAPNIGVLPRDMLYEILLRIPARPLCRFRTVCRSWRSLLSDPPFVAAHAAHHRDDPLIAMCVVVGDGHGYGKGDVAEIQLLDMSDGSVVKRVGNAARPAWLLRRMIPHLDLILMNVRDDDHPLRVLDPATGTVSLLSGYNDSYSSCVFGRAVSSTGGDGEYKVLSLSAHRLQYNTSATRWFCKILTVDGSGGGSSSQHGTWRDAPMPPVPIKTFDHRTIVASGVVYHLVDNDYFNDGWAIAAFDLEAEQWRPTLLQGPADAVPNIGHRTRTSLAEVNRRLAAVSSTVSTLNMWLLMGSGEQALWSKRHTVLISSILRDYVEAADTEPLWMLDDGRVAFCLRSHPTSTGMLWMYDPRTETCTHVADGLKKGLVVYTGNLLRQV